MQRLIATVFVSLWATAAFASFAIFQVRNLTVVNYNYVTDGGAACDGVQDDAAVFETVRQLFQASPAQVNLTIPNGRTCCITSSASPNGFFLAGIPNVVLIGTGATLKETCNGITFGYGIGGFGLSNPTISSKTASVSAGASSVTLLVAAEATNFVVGRYAIMTAIDLQGTGAFPPNPGIFEYVKIVGSNAGTGVVTFQSALTYSYLSTYPEYSTSGCNGACGGPARLYATNPSFDTVVEVRGLTLDQPSQATYGAGRSITYNGITATGTHCIVPTASMAVIIANSIMTSCVMEVDKILDSVTITNTAIAEVDVQSSSVHTLTMSSGTVVSGNINGTPQRFVGNGLTVGGTFGVGAIAYGGSSSVSCTDCVLAVIGSGGYHTNVSDYTISAGVISWANSNGPIPWCIPGQNMYFAGLYSSEGVPFQVTGLTTSGGNTHCATTLALSAFPTLPLQSGNLFVQTHPAPQFTCTNCTGSATAVDLSGAPVGVPLFSYSSRTYTCHTIAAAPTFSIRGSFVSGTYNVTVADSTQASLIGNVQNIETISGAGSEVAYNPKVNLKIAGSRVVTSSGVSGAQSGDVLSSPGSNWLASLDQVSIATGSDPTGDSPCLSMTITIQADQGVVNP